MQSAYEKITSYSGEHFEEYLQDRGIFKVFWEIFSRFKQVDYPEKIIKYIAHCYSVESDYVLRGGTWASIKENVAKLVELPECLYEIVVELGTSLKYDEKAEGWEEKKKEKDFQLKAVAQGIADFMNFENDRDNRHLKLLYDLYEEQLSGMADLKNSYDEKDKCRKRAYETKTEMEKIEQAIKNKMTNALKEGLREMAKMPTSLRPEIAAKK